MRKLNSTQNPSARDFPTEWYASASESHFWMQWRLNVIARHLRRLNLDADAPITGFDIGCGHGAFQRQLSLATSWKIDGCDLNEDAISRNSGQGGNVYLYNIFDFEPSIARKYNFVFLLDVIEHIPNPIEFIRAAHYYLRPGGYMVINVPAVPALYSKYDIAVGHIRRYTRASLQREILAAGLEVEEAIYWGMTLLPLLVLRKIVLMFTKSEDVISRGFTPPGYLAEKFLQLVMKAELVICKDVPWGTSVLAVVRKKAE